MCRLSGFLLGFSLLLGSTLALAQNNEQTHVTLHTNLGDIQLALFDQQATKTVENFLRYVNDGFYNDSLFHRITPSLIQGGLCGKGCRPKSPSYPPIQNEAANSTGHSVGTLGMMRGKDPHSATTQFFINVTDNRQRLDYASSTPLGWGYTVFGQVIDGMDVVEHIHQSKTDASGLNPYAPQKEIIIYSIEINQLAVQPVEPSKPTIVVKSKTPALKVDKTDKTDTARWLPEPPDVPAIE
jgi:cyclophilin family peptidyl-prolyl cis-trans isomerase